MKIKAHDTALTFTDTLTLDGSPVNLTGAAVSFRMKRRGTAFNAAATIVSALDGTVSYEPGGEFPVAPGDYQQEWQVTFADQSRLTFPSDRYNQITILEDL